MKKNENGQKYILFTYPFTLDYQKSKAIRKVKVCISAFTFRVDFEIMGKGKDIGKKAEESIDYLNQHAII